MSFDITTSSPVLVVVGNSGGNVLTDAAMSSGSYNHTFTGNGQTLWYGFACTVNQTMQLDNIRLTKTTGHGYEAVVVKTADYYPGGMIMPERHTQDIDYRFGYNGMEKDDEVSGNGNSYTTEFRQYDPRLLRWKSLDPLMASYPWMSPYCAFNNNSIYYIDPYGLEGQDNIHIYADGLIYIEQTDSETDTYIYHSCEGNELVLLDNVQKIGKEGQEMVNLPRETDYYKQMLYHQGSTYLPQDAAGGFLAAAYTYSTNNNNYKIKVNQLMTAAGEHSGKKYSRPAMDIQYVGTEETKWATQPESHHKNVDITKSNELANTFRQFGFNDAGMNNVLSENAMQTGPLLENSQYWSGHRNHFHVQGWSPPSGDFTPIRLMAGPPIVTPGIYKKVNREQVTDMLLNRMKSVGWSNLTEFERSSAIWVGIRPSY